MIARHVLPATALGHLAGKLTTVLYGMLRTMTVYDEARHRHDMGLPSNSEHLMAEPTHEIDPDCLDQVAQADDEDALITLDSIAAP